jgi:hypothetical protein
MPMDLTVLLLTICRCYSTKHAASERFPSCDITEFTW